MSKRTQSCAFKSKTAASIYFKQDNSEKAKIVEENNLILQIKTLRRNFIFYVNISNLKQKHLCIYTRSFFLIINARPEYASLVLFRNHLASMLVLQTQHV